MRRELTDQEHWFRSQMDHPAGTRYVGEHRTDVHPTEQEPPVMNGLYGSVAEGWMFFATILIIAALIGAVVLAQAWHLQGVSGLIIAAAIIILGVILWRRRR